MIKILIALILFVAFLPVQEEKVHTGKVARVGSFVTVVFDQLPNDEEICKAEEHKNKDECKYTILDIPKEEYPTKWKVVDVNFDTGVVTEREPQVGDVVKATGDKLVPLESCLVRRNIKVYTWRKNHPGYDRMPNILWSFDADCK